MTSKEKTWTWRDIPAGAVAENPGSSSDYLTGGWRSQRPVFTPDNCVQCGVCVATCPESVIKLEPRYNFTSNALSPAEIKTEEPFHCVSCGKAFGAKSSIERIVDRLRGHSMFKDEKQLELIQMCDNCRVVALAKSGNDPFASGERPRMRTTDDYFAEEQSTGTNGKKPDDFLG